MSAKLEKIGADLERARKKAKDWAEKARVLEEEYKKQESIEISDICRSFEMTPDKLKRLLERTGNGLPNPGLAEAIEKEEEDNE
jgi:hypothetical protein